MLKRLLIAVLAFALVAGITAQLMPHDAMIAEAKAAMPCEAMDMSAASVNSSTMPDDMPCKGMIPVCNDSIGCAVVVDLPAPVRAAPVAVHWTVVVWSAAPSTLAGRTLEPELTPPIGIA